MDYGVSITKVQVLVQPIAHLNLLCEREYPVLHKRRLSINVRLSGRVRGPARTRVTHEALGSGSEKVMRLFLTTLA